MSNWYTTGTLLKEGSVAYATDVNAHLTAIETAFSKLPDPDRLAKSVLYWADDTGTTANTMLATISWPSAANVTSYHDGMLLVVEPAVTNTGASTITVNALPTVPVTNADGSALSGGELVAGSPTLLVYRSGAFRIVSAGSSSSSSSSGTPVTQGLAFDGVTDDSAALKSLIDGAIAAGNDYLEIFPPSGGVLALGIGVQIYQPTPGRSFILDLRRCKIKRLNWTTRIRSNGRVSEWPADPTPKPVLKTSASQGATSITIDLKGNSISRFVAGARIIIRGEQDAAGLPLESPQQKHETTLAANATDNGDGTATLSLTDPLPAAFEPSYPNSAWATSPLNSSGKDETLITVVNVWMIGGTGGDPQVGDTAIAVTSDPTGTLSVGDYVMIEDDAKAQDGYPTGASTNAVHFDIARVATVTATTVTIDRPLEHAYSTAKAARITKILPSYNVGIFGALADEFAQDADPTGSRIPYYEQRYSVGGFIRDVIVREDATTYASRGAAVRVERSRDITVERVARWGRTDTTHSASGDRYGVHIVQSDAVRVSDCFFVRNRHGIVVQTGTRIRGTRIFGVDCGNVLDMHGLEAVDVSWSDCHGIVGTWLPSGFTEQKFATIGNTKHGNRDQRITLIGCTATGYTGGSGAVEVRAPCRKVTTIGCVCHDGSDWVTVKQLSTQPANWAAGEVSVESLVMHNSTGYAVDVDATTTNAWSSGTCTIGVVLADGTEAGTFSSSVGDSAVRPDLVPDKGTLVTLETTISSFPYTTSNNDLALQKNSTRFDLTRKRLAVGSPDGTAKQINLHQDAAVEDEIWIVVPDAQTGTVTLGLAGNATFEDGGTTWTAKEPIGGGIDRHLRVRCVRNADGQSAVWRVLGESDAVPKNNRYEVDYPLNAPRVTTTFSASSNFSALVWQGAIIVFDGGAAATLTLDAIPDVRSGVPFDGVWPLLNKSNPASNLTVQISGSGSYTLPAGEGATLVRAGGVWHIFPAGAYTV